MIGSNVMKDTEDDHELDEVINLSPKKVVLESNNNEIGSH